MKTEEKINITGSDGKTHLVDPAIIDRFFSGKTGEPITDEQWDESERRRKLAESEEAGS